MNEESDSRGLLTDNLLKIEPKKIKEMAIEYCFSCLEIYYKHTAGLLERKKLFQSIYQVQHAAVL